MEPLFEKRYLFAAPSPHDSLHFTRLLGVAQIFSGTSKYPFFNHLLEKESHGQCSIFVVFPFPAKQNRSV
jgi:hypothetical protein